MKKVFGALVSLTMLFPVETAFAHEGHGNPEWARSVLHYLLEPEHLAVTLPAAVAVLFIGKFASKRMLQKMGLARRP